MYVEVVGRGPPLVLLHGWAMHGGVFAPLLARLRARHTVHVVDLPGHGRSRDCAVPLQLQPCVAAIAATVPVAPWCGWSLGGLFALHAASTLPQRVPALALLCASPRFVRGADWRYGVSAEIFGDFAAGLRADYRATLERFVALEAFGAEHAREAIRALREELFAQGAPSAAVLADGLALLQTADLRPALPQLRVPSLWLAGRRDRLVDARAMAAAAALTPGAAWHVFEHAGHAPFLTHADALAARLAAFLDTPA
ncbi:pimeloyl-ACP methyl ester esterase BioH [Cognatiluteimonas weifangensis]|uniref:Pimeloyl-[acyl-carrier protein] methyl ester esterase n=1 Tax=Cognatiluteimonas weifangensis TaxID=2303539 RepID=A0A372DPZ4_9GAMM|nr:pimeloyl-ACP methyl ester esterase BioH [Luteimonas weifangensis]RFP61619.1 pimeloyl-[acyl-carrier protein] methyl ester esterase [Luteimonas weifangensis]